MKKGLVNVITMGCSKNLVDSEALIDKFQKAGYLCKHDPKRIDGEIVVINTCGFIEDAKQESIDTILELVQAKEEGRRDISQNWKRRFRRWTSITASSTSVS